MGFFNTHHRFSYHLGQVGADDKAVLDQIIDSLTSLANSDENYGILNKEANKISLTVGKVQENDIKEYDIKGKTTVLIIGAGHVCRPAAELLSSVGSISSREWYKPGSDTDVEDQNAVQVIVASLYLKDAEQVY